ncbi:hypothetical protein GTY41_06325 [Streptomyces sp. SID685]|uniref:hypothetical protein n=1 Tax=Streptomyces TaxID=1883 RepID=UPI0013708F91|nr:hypothetical protein [Streptomyces sp. SID685]
MWVDPEDDPRESVGGSVAGGSATLRDHLAGCSAWWHLAEVERDRRGWIDDEEPRPMPRRRRIRTSGSGRARTASRSVSAARS